MCLSHANEPPGTCQPALYVGSCRHQSELSIWSPLPHDLARLLLLPTPPLRVGAVTIQLAKLCCPFVVLFSLIPTSNQLSRGWLFVVVVFPPFPNCWSLPHMLAQNPCSHYNPDRHLKCLSKAPKIKCYNSLRRKILYPKILFAPSTLSLSVCVSLGCMREPESLLSILCRPGCVDQADPRLTDPAAFAFQVMG